MSQNLLILDDKELICNAPKLKSEFDVGYSLFLPFDITLEAQSSSVVDTCVILNPKWFEQNNIESMGTWARNEHSPDIERDIKKSNYLEFCLNEELAFKGCLLNCGTHIISLDRKESIKVIIYNSTDKDIKLKKNEILGQILVHRRYLNIEKYQAS